MNKINISLSKEFLSKLDQYSCKENMNRSKFIREAVAKYIAIKEEDERIKEKEKKIEKTIEFFKKMGEKNKNWNGVKEINKWREKL
jgi:metal-responsive CopG/Arc/MetJ family transcriptional regulator